MSSPPTPLLDRLYARLTWRNAAVALAVLVAANLALMTYVLPGIAARRPQAMQDDFPAMIDREPLRSPEEIYEILGLYTPDILDLVRTLYALDLVIPLALAFVLAVVFAKLLRRPGTTPGWRPLVLLPFAGASFDCVENLLALMLISLDGVYPLLARIAGIVTACKFLCLLLTGLTLLALLVRAAARRLGSRP